MAEVFESERLIYRAVEESDDPFILEMHQDSESHMKTNARLPIPRGKKKSAKELRDFFDSCLMAAVICIPPATPWATKENMTAIGTITLSDTPRERHFRNTILDITLDRSYQRQGYGSEAMRWALDWAFRRAGLHKVCLWCYEYNFGAMRLCSKMGFVAEARLREHVWHDGRFWDDCGFSILEREWRERYRGSRSYSSAGLFGTARPSTSQTSSFRPINSISESSDGGGQIPTPESMVTTSSTTSQCHPPAPAPINTSLPPGTVLPEPPESTPSATPQTYQSPFAPINTSIKFQSSPTSPQQHLAPKTYPWTLPQKDLDAVFEFRTLKESTLTVAELWREWHEGYPKEGRPSVEWMEDTHKGNWRKKQYGAPGASCQYFSQRKRVIDEVRSLVDGGEFGTVDEAIVHLDGRMRTEGMPSLNKLANELKRESGVQKRRRSER